MIKEWYFAFTESNIESGSAARSATIAWAKKTPFPAKWDSHKALTSCFGEDVHFEIGMDEASAKAKLELSLAELEAQS